ncbi:MAG TPA: hypothetical protein VGB42_05025 [Candidatus Thermoplasmatota archaeon]
MSYRGNGILAIILGIVFLPVFLTGLIMIWRGLRLLKAYNKPLEPGTNPDVCIRANLGFDMHDWRPSLAGYPPGKACRNCLKRKDRAVIAWASWPPSSVPVEQVPPHPVWIPRNVAKVVRRRGGTPKFLMMDAQRSPAASPEIKMEVVGFGRP